MGASTAVLDPPVSAGRRPRRRSARITTPLVAGLGTAAAVAAHWRSAADGGQAWLDLAVGLLLGAVAVAARPTSGRSAAWACAAGVAWLVGPAVPPALWLHRPLLVVLVLSFPLGRLASARDRVAVAAVAACSLVPAVARDELAMTVVGLGVVAVAVAERRTADLAGRSMADARLAAAVALGGAFAGTAAVRLATTDAAPADLLYSALVATTAGILLVRLTRRRDDAATDAVVRLAEVDAGATLARLEAAPAAALDPPTRATVASAVALLRRNRSLQEELAAAVDEARRARRRLADSTFAERRALERRLAPQALPAVAELERLLATLPASNDRPATALGECCRQLTGIRDDLDQLARGLLPRRLAEDGLAALDDVATRAPVPVDLSVAPGRLPRAVEEAVWYACTEALTNVARHSGATWARLTVAVAADTVVACVEDDGRGGATLEPGGGIAGLRDRLAAVGGRLVVVSPVGGGTSVRMEVPIPCG